MEISFVLAVADNGVIGNKGDIPWRQSADMKFFREKTKDGTIIMGRATFESFKNGPLPDRHNIIITRNTEYQAEGATIAHSIDEALELAGDVDEVFIIGGGTIYEQALPRATKLYLTRIHAEPDGDTFFTFDARDWQLIHQENHSADQKNQYDYSFETYARPL
jgi:dihydrofolate reductase